MKVGDKYPVTIAGQVVAQADVREMGEGTATLVVPGTIVVMAVRTELTTPEPVEGAHVIIDDVERTSGEVSGEVANIAPDGSALATPPQPPTAVSQQEQVKENESTAPVETAEPTQPVATVVPEPPVTEQG